MRTLAFALAALAACTLAGCLEVEQHPAWRRGAYDGKPDQRPQDSVYHGSRLSWNAAVSDRTQKQNEYVRSP